MALCNVTNKTKEQRMQAMSDVYDYWQSKDNIVDRFSNIVGGRRSYDPHSSAENMKWFIEQRLEKPWDSDSPLTDADYRRIRVEIDSFDKALKGKFSNLAWVVPEGISKQDPTARKFYLKLNEILNYERVQTNSVLTANSYIANHMLDAYMSEFGTKKGKGDLAIKELRDLRREMVEADPNEHVQAEFINKIENFVNSDKGRTIKQFLELVQMNKEVFKKAKLPDYRDESGNLKAYNPHVYKAVEKARENLNELSGVYTNGLVGLQKIIALKYTNNSDIKAARTNKQARRMIDIIEDSITDVKAGREKGGYFPHVQFETLMQIKDKLSQAMIADKTTMDYKFSDVVDNILAKVDINKIPAHAQKRNPTLEQYWEKDPLMVLKEYGDQATQFNKLVNTQIEYLDALRHLPLTDIKFQKGLKRFLQEEYAVFTMGTSERPAFVNKAVTTLNALQTARTMGLNITGAVKNAASAIHFYSRVGLKAFKDAKKAMEHDSEFQSIIKEAEKEAGFLFQDVAQELYTEGVITRKDMETKAITYDPIKNKITMDGNNVGDLLKKAGKNTIKVGLFFHRLTENNQRKWMFRTAFHKKYASLVNQGYDSAKAKRFSQAYALKMVNAWAYEYAAHAKSKWLRGEWRTVEEMQDGTISKKLQGAAGGMTELGMHLLHYPMSLFETHYDALKGLHKSVLAKQGFESEEIQYAMRYAGVSGLVGLASVVMNTDLFNIIENESAERIKRVVDDLTEYDNPDRGTFGLLGQISGTNVGTLKHLLIANEFIDIEYSDLNKIIFGNVDFSDDSDKLTDMYSAYQISTAWGVTKNKLWPAIKSGRGRDLLTHWLKLYPSEWTKEGRKFLFGDKSKKKERQFEQELSGYDKNVKNAIQALEKIRMVR